MRPEVARQMLQSEMVVGARVRTNRPFAGIPRGTDGVVIQVLGNGLGAKYVVSLGGDEKRLSFNAIEIKWLDRP